MKNINNKQAIEPSINDAFQVWWWFTWRTTLISIGISIVLNLLVEWFNLRSEITQSLIDSVVLIILVVLSVIFVKKSLNRKYKGFELVVKK